MAWQLKGKVAKCERREYGFAQIQVKKIGNGGDALFEGLGDELEVRERVATLQSDIGLLWKVYRSGCLTEINSLKFLRTSTSSGIHIMPHSRPSHITTSRGTASSFTPRSPIHHAGEKLLESSFSTSVIVPRVGPWSVMTFERGCSRTPLTIANAITRKSSLVRKSHVFVRSVGQRGE